ncbi:vacuolar membrane protease [Monosporozyma unispora]
MSFTNFLRLTFGYRKTNTSLLFCIGSLLIALLFIYDQIGYKYLLPPDDGSIPIRYVLENSWDDLQNITFSYHPYTSRDNERVHDYIWFRVNEITSNIDYADLYDDMRNNSNSIFRQQDTFNASSTKTRVIYFESSNILVKLEGSDPSLSALLLSSHFDSVPTSHGATDDGKGIASMLGLLKYYSSNQPKRTMIFNFNNNEEFGLLGATHFLNHEWAYLVEYFINLEGTGTGSKSVLFRTSDIDTAKIYRDSVKSQPFGNSIFQEGFNRRVISSETDYKVYDNFGYRGWDIAFYKPRDLYHTKSDDIQHTSREALWNMLHTSWQISYFLATMQDSSSYNDKPAIYFDVVGLDFFAMSASDLFIVNCVLLTVVPLVLSVLYSLTKSKHQIQNSNVITWLRLPFCVVIGIGFINVTELFLRETNPFIMFRNSFAPFFTLLLEFLLIILIVDPFIAYFWPDDKIKDVNLIEITSIFWLVTIYNTYSLYSSEYQNTGAYLFSLVFVGLALTLLVKFVAALLYRTVPKDEPVISTVHSNTNSTYGATSQIDINEQTENTMITSTPENSEDERAPLIDSQQVITDDEQAPDVVQSPPPKIIRSQYEWTIQLIILFPVLLLTYQSILEVLDAVSQTVVESNKALEFVWDILFLGTIVLGLLHAPFLNLRFELISILMVLFLGLFSFDILGDPFTANTPLKVRFGQDTDGLVTLGGIGTNIDFMKDLILDLPSFKQGPGWINCNRRMQTCSYQGIPPNLIDWNHSNGDLDAMSVKVLHNDRKGGNRSKYEPMNADVLLKVEENRACNIYFNETSKDSSSVKEITIYEGKSDTIKKRFKWSKGIEELQLHKLDFDQPYYRIGIRWFPKILSNDDFTSKRNVADDNDGDVDKLGLKVTCYWGEFDTEVIVDGVHKRKVPAFDELLLYSPISYSFSNKEKGIVYHSKYIEL